MRNKVKNNLDLREEGVLIKTGIRLGFENLFENKSLIKEILIHKILRFNRKIQFWVNKILLSL